MAGIKWPCFTIKLKLPKGGARYGYCKNGKRSGFVPLEVSRLKNITCSLKAA
jgi:hypothetical protein